MWIGILPVRVVTQAQPRMALPLETLSIVPVTFALKAGSEKVEQSSKARMLRGVIMRFPYCGYRNQLYLLKKQALPRTNDFSFLANAHSIFFMPNT
jgi:hypothetical protein